MSTLELYCVAFFQVTIKDESHKELYTTALLSLEFCVGRGILLCFCFVEK